MIGVDHLNSGVRRGQVHSDVDITAWRLDNLQAKWCVRSKHVVFYDYSVIYYLITLYTVALTSFIRYTIVLRDALPQVQVLDTLW